MSPPSNTFTIVNGNILKQSYDPTLDKQARETWEAMEFELLERQEKEKWAKGNPSS